MSYHQYSAVNPNEDEETPVNTSNASEESKSTDPVAAYTSAYSSAYDTVDTVLESSPSASSHPSPSPNVPPTATVTITPQNIVNQVVRSVLPSVTRQHSLLTLKSSNSQNYYNSYHGSGSENGSGEGESASASTPSPLSLSSSPSSSPSPLRSISPSLQQILSSPPQWQSDFESILSLPAIVDPDRLLRSSRLRSLIQRFQSACKEICTCVVEDSPLPENQKRFKSLSGKGIAGGEKYSEGNIFIKMTTDKMGIYGGDYGANKAAKHEIKSLQSLIQCEIHQLYFPLMCIIDYLGLRLVCTSHLSGIGNTSLVYGSQDAGRTINVDNVQMNGKIKLACDKLNLKGHHVVGSDGVGKFIYGAADLEGHIVKEIDKDTKKEITKYYMLDFARLFPPESYLKTPHGDHINGLVIPSSLSKAVTALQEKNTANKLIRKYLLEELWIEGVGSEGMAEKKDQVATVPKTTFINHLNREKFDKLESDIEDKKKKLQKEREDAEKKIKEDEKKNEKKETEGTSKSSSESSSASSSDSPPCVSPSPPSDDFSSSRHPLPLTPKWLFKSEGLLIYNTTSIGDFNPRASAIGQVTIRGTALLFRETGSIFFRLMRPELLKMSSLPISSDCFSGFGGCKYCKVKKRVGVESEGGGCPHNAIVNHEEANALTSFLLSSNGPISLLAQKLNQHDIAPTDSVELINVMHSYGINIRHMGELRYKVTQHHIREMMLVEMITRTIRHILAGMLRTSHTRSHTMPIPDDKSNVSGNGDNVNRGSTDIENKYHNEEIYQKEKDYVIAYESSIMYPAPVMSGNDEESKRKYTSLITTLADEDEVEKNKISSNKQPLSSPSTSTDNNIPNPSHTYPRLLHSVSCEDVVIQLFNLVFGNSAKSSRFWKGIGHSMEDNDHVDEKKDQKSTSPPADKLGPEELQRLVVEGQSGELRSSLQRKFPECLTTRELDPPYDLRRRLLKFPLLIRLCEVSGISLTSSCYSLFFNDSKCFEKEGGRPFKREDFKSFNAKAKSIDYDKIIHDIVLNMAIEHSQKKEKQEEAVASSLPSSPSFPSSPSPSSPPSSSSSSSSSLSLREYYDELSSLHLGPTHPLVLQNRLKLCNDYSLQRRFALSLEIIEKTIRQSKELYGEYSVHYISALIGCGEILLYKYDEEENQRMTKKGKDYKSDTNESKEKDAPSPHSVSDLQQSLNNFHLALLCLQRMYSYHPLIGKLNGYIGRLYLLLNSIDPLLSSQGIYYLSKSNEIFSSFYGPSVASYVTPVIVMGKGAEYAKSLCQLALLMKPAVLDAMRKKKEERRKKMLEAGERHDGVDDSDNENSNGTEVTIDSLSNESNDSLSLSSSSIPPVIISPSLILSEYRRIKNTIEVLEETSGLSRGFYLGDSLNFDVDEDGNDGGDKGKGKAKGKTVSICSPWWDMSYRRMKSHAKRANKRLKGEWMKGEEWKSEGEKDTFPPQSLYPHEHIDAFSIDMSTFLSSESASSDSSAPSLSSLVLPAATAGESYAFSVYSFSPPRCVLSVTNPWGKEGKTSLIPFIYEASEHIYNSVAAAAVALNDSSAPSTTLRPLTKYRLIFTPTFSRPYAILLSGSFIDKIGDVQERNILLSLTVLSGHPYPSHFVVNGDMIDNEYALKEYTSHNRIPLPERKFQVDQPHTLNVFLYDTNNNAIKKESYDRVSQFPLFNNAMNSSFTHLNASLQFQGQINWDREEGKCVVTFSPSREGNHFIFLLWEQERFFNYYYFFASSPSGIRSCEQPLFGGPKQAALYCVKCATQNKNKCHSCRVMLLPGRSTFASCCQQCTIRRSCCSCGNLVPVFNSTHALVCLTCGMKAGSNKCVGKILMMK